ncbi:MAG: response regulator [Roseivirga sp.]|nr:response regulator [Roseivirga sp.]
MRKGFLLCLMVLISAQAFSQSPFLSDEYILKRWTVEDGLPVNVVVSMTQTQDGYLWMSTYDGLVRFDGDQFTVFNTGNTSELPTNRFISLKTDRHDNLWILSEKVQNNRVLIRYRAGEFEVFNTRHGLEGNVTMHLGVKGNLFVASAGTALYYDGTTFQPFGEELRGKSVRRTTRDANGVYWFATDDGVIRMEDGVWTQLTEQDGLNSRNVITTHADQQGRIWIATDTGVNLLQNEKITSYSIDKAVGGNRGQNFIENRHTGEMFLLRGAHFLYKYTDGGFVSYPADINQGEPGLTVQIGLTGSVFTKVRNKLFKDGKLIFRTNTGVGSMFEDKAGNIWITRPDGLYQLKPRLIRTYNQHISSVYSLTEDHDGQIWATQNFQKLLKLEGGSFRNKTYEVKDSMAVPSQQALLALYTSSDSLLWIGGSFGAYRWDKKSRPDLIKVPEDESQRQDPRRQMRQIRAIAEDAEGNMWFGSINGIYRLNKKGNWKHIDKAGDRDIAEVRQIHVAGDSTLWFGTNGNGLFHLKVGKFNQLNSSQGLSGNIIRSMYEDEQGILWVGTEGWGLNRIEQNSSVEPDAPEITVIKKQDGLFDNVIHQILEDDQGRFWMNSNRGIFWVYKSELNAFAKGESSSVYSFFYNEQDGLPGREGNGGVQTAGFKSKNGELWFPMQGGVVRIDPALVNTSPLNLFIEQVITTDSAWYVGDLTERVIPLGERDFQIGFAALDFSTSPANIRYRYKLEGENDDWIEADDRREAIYNNLTPGTYTFRVMANNGGGWSVNQASLQITLPYFFYETYWFYALVILLIALVVYAVVNWRIRMLKRRSKELEEQVILRTQDLVREKEETERQKEIATKALVTIEKQAAALKELDKAKSRFFTNISHEFRTPLTLIIGPLEEQIEKLREGLVGDEEDMEVALRNSKRLLRLVNQILEVAKLESGHTQLKAHLVDIRTVIEPITDAFMSLAERNGTQFNIEWPDQSRMIYVDIDLMEKAIINLLSNAFKFTPGHGTIEVRVEHRQDVSISIKDNGPGIAKKDQEHIFERFYQVNESGKGMQPGTGIGLSLVHELIALHGGTIELISEPGLGSEFIIKLPTGKAHLKDDQFTSPQSPDNGQRIEEFTEAFKEAEEQPVISNALNGQVTDQPVLLIVEDNADIRAYVRKHLSAEYRIVEAENGLEGFKMTEETLPDLVISDIMMPLSDGYELCTRIKQHPDLDFIPVILLTAKAEKSMKIEGLDLGADDYVIKPFEIDELKARVRNLIQSRKKLKERLAGTEMPAEIPDLSGWVDTPFANRVRLVIEENIGNEDFSVVQLADAVQVGRTTLYSRMVELTGKTPSEMIKRTRLYQASKLLMEEAGNISEIAYATGFKSISHFSKTFKAEFGVVPTQYAKPSLETDQP